MRALLPVLLLLSLVAPGAAQAASAGPASIEGAWLAPVALSDADDPVSLAEPEALLLVIYSHGSRPEFRRDRCRPRGDTTPEVVRDLAGLPAGDLTVAVFALCTQALTGSFEARSGIGEPKVVERAREIAELARRFTEAGVPPRRIVLAGQSAGGWASLLAAARGDLPLGGVIAFAPAFAGRSEGRPEAWQVLREAQAAELVETLAADPRQGTPLLVYAFAGDPYEAPAELAFLGALPEATMRSGPPAAECAPHEPHLRAFADCFRAERQRLLAFLAERAGPAGGA